MCHLISWSCTFFCTYIVMHRHTCTRPRSYLHVHTFTLSHFLISFLGSSQRQDQLFSASNRNRHNIRFISSWLLFYMMLISAEPLCKRFAKLIIIQLFPCFNKTMRILAAVTYKSGKTENLLPVLLKDGGSTKWEGGREKLIGGSYFNSRVFLSVIWRAL